MPLPSFSNEDLEEEEEEEEEEVETEGEVKSETEPKSKDEVQAPSPETIQNEVVRPQPVPQPDITPVVVTPSPLQSEESAPAVQFLPQKDDITTLSMGAYTGLTAAVNHYSKALPFEYESLRLPAFGGWADFNVNKLLFSLDFKSMPAQVKSSSGNLNVFGWKYSHLWGSLASGYLYDNKHHVYFKLSVQYLPTLFPTQVGVFQSTAAFEKIPAFGIGLGYKTYLSIYDIPVQVQTDLYNVQITDSNYDLKYGLAYSLKLTPYYMWRNLKFGLSYEYLGQILSLTEKNTGQDYPFKSRLGLHQLLISLESKIF